MVMYSQKLQLWENNGNAVWHISSSNVGLGTTSYVSLRSERIGGTTTTAGGSEIGRAKVYNFSAESINLNDQDPSEPKERG